MVPVPVKPAKEESKEEEKEEGKAANDDDGYGRKRRYRSCKKGLYWHYVHQECEDIDECKQDDDICHHGYCHNYYGGYKCIYNRRHGYGPKLHQSCYDLGFDVKKDTRFDINNVNFNDVNGKTTGDDVIANVRAFEITTFGIDQCCQFCAKEKNCKAVQIGSPKAPANGDFVNCILLDNDGLDQDLEGTKFNVDIAIRKRYPRRRHYGYGYRRSYGNRYNGYH